MKDVRLPEANHLQTGKSFRDTARVLKMTRFMVGWEATGCQMGAYEHALKYAQERLQFGKPIAKSQMIQSILVNMLGDVTAMQLYCIRLGRLIDDGKLEGSQQATGEQRDGGRFRCAINRRRQRHRYAQAARVVIPTKRIHRSEK
jgi:glutaryl-CoA dehydrogenase